MAENIIKFPKRRRTRRRITDVLVDRLTALDTHVDLGHVPFTCAECNTVAGFDFTNLIFKQVTFYCSGCGHGYRVSNPMFSDPTVRVRVITGQG